MATSFLYQRDSSGWPSSGLPVCTNILGVKLAANTEQHIAVPATDGKYTKFLAKFAYQSATHVFVGINVTAAAPTGTIGTVNAELMPYELVVNKGDTISLIEPDNTAYITVALYGIS